MRMINVFLGLNAETRNKPLELYDPRPVARFADNVTTGNAGLDGHTVLSRANPGWQGRPPYVEGDLGPVYWDEGSSFEQ